MTKRFASLWFPHLAIDRMMRLHPRLREMPFVLAIPEHGRMVVTAASRPARRHGITAAMAVADARALVPGLQVLDYQPDMAARVLGALALWCLRYTPVAAVDLPDGLLLDISGCAHLWGGERPYLQDLASRIEGYGYEIRLAIAGTPGAAWALAHYGPPASIIESGSEAAVLADLPAAALRLEAAAEQRLVKLGLCRIGDFMHLPRPSLHRRIGAGMLKRLDQALGREVELIRPVQPPPRYREQLPCIEPVSTPGGIAIALTRLLEQLGKRLEKEGKGVRSCLFNACRVDGDIQQVGIATSRASRNIDHLMKLFEPGLSRLKPDLGFERFTIEAPVVEKITVEQDSLWAHSPAQSEVHFSELLDRIALKTGAGAIHRYLPAEDYWPEHSFKAASGLGQQPESDWNVLIPRPLHLLPRPEPIEVSVPLPDYPPMHFRYRGKLHRITKADGPERIEQPWWRHRGLYRDYYCVEDEAAGRYWLFRSGDYSRGTARWFVHGFFA